MPAQYDLTPPEGPFMASPAFSYLGSRGYPYVKLPVYQYMVFPDRYDEGYDDGYSDGYDAGWLDGYDQGYTDGFDDGLNNCPPPEEPPKIVSQSVTSNGDGTISITASSDKPGYLVVLVEVYGKYKTVYTDYYPETSWNLVLPEPKVEEYRVHLVLSPPIKEEVNA